MYAPRTTRSYTMKPKEPGRLDRSIPPAGMLGRIRKDAGRSRAPRRRSSFRIRPSIPAGGILRSNRPGSFGFILYNLVVLGAYIPPTGGEGYGLWPSGEWLPDAAKKFISKWEG